MSWQTTIQNKFIITTGDGKQYFPLWRNTAIKEIEYNIAQFEFPNIAGSLIKRAMPKGREFSLDICFQGENNITDAENFEKSANDSRAWNISHPIYGAILCQPVKLKFDYSGYNVASITGSVIETLGSAGIQFVVVPMDKINHDKETCDDDQASVFNIELSQRLAQELNGDDISAANQIIGTRTITQLKGINLALYDIAVKQVKLTEDAGNFLNLFNNANSAINNLLTAPEEAMRALQAVINYPALFVTSITSRLSVMQSQFDYLTLQLTTTSNRTEKVIHEVVSGAIITSVAKGSITSYDKNNEVVTGGQLPDYNTRADVLTVIGRIQSITTAYLANLDSLQTDNGGGEDSYIPDSQSLSDILDLTNFTIENLYTIALSAKQERSIMLTEDSNLIILAHRFYGLAVDDSTIDTLIKNNNICLDEILQIKKNRSLVYYV